jgi:spectinomycin phosphotransferase
MFVVGDAQEDQFFQGYGRTEINTLALAYYGYEWVVQEIGDYAERVFFMPELGAATRADAVQEFKALFQPGNVVEAAYNSERQLPPVLPVTPTHKR